MTQVSVISACYNHGKYIHEMLDSVLNQSFQDFEVIIVNDGSTDNTADILEEINHEKVRIILTDNLGPAHARNLAIKNAKGALILNLDADDKIAPTFLEKCVEILKKQSNIGIVYSDVELFGHNNGRFSLPDYTFENMLQANCIIANACFRKDDWEKTEGYSSELKDGYEDFDFWLSILELGKDVYQIKEPLSFYRTYENDQNSRSGICKNDTYKMQKVIIQAFQRHRNLYQKNAAIYEQFRQMEKQYLVTNQKINNYLDAPTFSIITPTNNRPQLLKRAIFSVIHQSFTNWEQIIIDDGNNTETTKVIAEINDKRIRYYVHEKPRGASAAYNTGIKYAKGQLINFLDDDDEYLPEILEKLFQTFLSAKNNPGFVWTGITKVRDENGDDKPFLTQQWPTYFPSLKDGLLVSTAIGNGYGLSVKKECIDEIGLYDESLKVGVDTDFMIRLSEKFTFCTVPEVLVKIHIHGNSQLTHEKHEKLRWKAYKTIIERHFEFLSQNWEVINMHLRVYLDLCFRVNEKAAGRQAVWELLKKFPSNYLIQKDFICFFIFGKDSQSCHALIKNNTQNFKTKINNLWLWKKGKEILLMSPIIKTSKYIVGISTKNQPHKTIEVERFPLQIVSGFTKTNLLPISFAYIGQNPKIPFIWSDWILEKPEFHQRKSIEKASLLDNLKKEIPNSSILLMDQEIVNLETEGMKFPVPNFMQTYIDISQPLENLKHRKNLGFANAKRLIKKHQLSYRMVNTDEGQKDFYENMYLPYQNNRHQNNFIKVEFEGIFHDSFPYEMIHILKNGEAILGGIVRFKSNGVYFSFLGIRDGKFEHVQNGAISASYYFLYHELHKRGYKKLFLGGTSPFLNHSLTKYKIRMNAEIDHDYQYQKQELTSLQILNHSEANRDFLASSPFVFINEKGKHCAAFWKDSETAQESEFLQKQLSNAALLNLKNNMIFSFSENNFINDNFNI